MRKALWGLVAWWVTGPLAIAQSPPLPAANSSSPAPSPGPAGASSSTADLPPERPPGATSPLRPNLSRQMAFSIPFSVDKAHATGTEVQLFVSVDQGHRWQLYASRHPDQGQFPFRATQDGDYWFASRTVPLQERNRPPGRLVPELHVRIDTVEPRLQFQALPGPAGEVRLVWRAQDPNLEPASLRVEYQAGAAQGWQVIPLTPGTAVQGQLSGEYLWQTPGDARLVDLRAEIRDKAGNRAQAAQRAFLPKVNVPAAVGKLTDLANKLLAPASSAAPPADPYATRTAPGANIPWPADNRLPASGAAARDTPPSAAAAGIAAPEHRPPEARGMAPSSASPSRAPEDVLSQTERYRPVEGQVQPPVADRPGRLVSQSPGPAPSAGDPVQPSSAPPASAASPATQVASAGPPPGERPQLTSALRFDLEYDIESIGPSGVSEVELWATRDGGPTWTKWGSDTDKQSPFQIEVQEEGLYGFRMVVVGGTGLASRRPLANDPADLWVQVDRTQPTARITSAIYGSAQNAGQLDIRWEAADANLGERPVSLYFGASADGPWTVIAGGLPNSGQHFWTVDPSVPQQVFLKIEVRDEAGNVGSSHVPEAISIEALAPQGRIRGLRSLNESKRLLPSDRSHR